MGSVLLDVAGHRRSPATLLGYHRGRPPRNKGEHYPADPPTVEEIVGVMRTIGDRSDGHRLRALIMLLRRAGLRISEALALQESDLDRSPHEPAADQALHNHQPGRLGIISARHNEEGDGSGACHVAPSVSGLTSRCASGAREKAILIGSTLVTGESDATVPTPDWKLLRFIRFSFRARRRGCVDASKVGRRATPSRPCASLVPTQAKLNRSRERAP